MGPARDGFYRHDDDIEPAICLGAFHWAPSEDNRRASLRCAMDDHNRDRASDMARSAPGLARGEVRAKASDWRGRASERTWMGRHRAGHDTARALPDLRAYVRARHGHRLYRRGRADGEMVSRTARICGWRRRLGLWFRSDSDNLPDRRHDQLFGLHADAGGFRVAIRGRRTFRSSVSPRA